jgi:hypothetical protein
MPNSPPSVERLAAEQDAAGEHRHEEIRRQGADHGDEAEHDDDHHQDDGDGDPHAGVLGEQLPALLEPAGSGW